MEGFNFRILFRVTFIIILVRLGASQINKNNLCTDISNTDACQQIDRDQQIKCKYSSTKTDCILDIEKGIPTLTLVRPEEAFLAANLVTDNVMVIGEIIAEKAPFETVVLVKNTYTGGLGESLRGLKYCHPGYDHDERITRYVLEEFDWKSINIDCGNETLTEQKFRALANFFGSSCRPGKWTEDATFDAYLKNQYPSLCELCGLGGCNVRYSAPLNATLECLLGSDGDIALTDRQYAAALFESSALNQSSYLYLCPNGTVSTTACTWSKQLNRLIVTDSNSVSVMVMYLQEKLTSYITTVALPDITEQYLAAVLPLSRSDKVNLVTATPLRTYVSAVRSILDPLQPENSKCDPLRWSVTNELEENKCLWLKQASLTHGLLPNIDCVKSTDNDTVSNLDNLQNNIADVAFIDASFGYVARRKNLSNVAYTETVTNQLSRIVIVVNDNITWYSNLTDLQGKSICLPQYGGKEWLAYIDLLRTNGLVADSTNYGQIFSNFVGESCTPGANSKDIDITDTDSEKLCSRCIPVSGNTTAKYCNADYENKYYSSNGALTCLEDNNGDYAVIDLNDLSRRFRRPDASEKFRIISKNGSLASYRGLDVDEDAPIVIIVAGEVVYRNVSLVRYNDTVLFLQHMEVEFGMNLEKAFKVFETFNDTKDLLFPDSTPGLTFTDSNRYISNYIRLLNNSERALSTTGGSSRATLSSVVLVLLFTVATSAF